MQYLVCMLVFHSCSLCVKQRQLKCVWMSCWAGCSGWWRFSTVSWLISVFLLMFFWHLHQQWLYLINRRLRSSYDWRYENTIILIILSLVSFNKENNCLLYKIASFFYVQSEQTNWWIYDFSNLYFFLNHQTLFFMIFLQKISYSDSF